MYLELYLPFPWLKNLYMGWETAMNNEPTVGGKASSKAIPRNSTSRSIKTLWPPWLKKPAKAPTES